MPGLASRAVTVRQQLQDLRYAARLVTRETGEDAVEVRDWVWPPR